MTEHRNHEWNEMYASRERLFSAEPDAALVELAAGLEPGRALDLGAGEGRNSLWLARSGWEVTAIDLSDVALGRLADAAARAGLTLTTVVGDIEEYLAHAARIDLVVLANLHPLPEERTRLFRLAAEALVPGGHLFLVGHHLDSLGRAGPPQAERLYTEETLRDAFPGLELLRLERRAGHIGDTAEPLVDVIAWAVRSGDPGDTASGRPAS